MDETLFYIAGGALIVVALILSLIGMRSDKFPSGRFLTAGIVVVFLLVAATAVGAVELAQHEQTQRLGEANAEADAASAAEDTINQDTGDTGEVTPATQDSGTGSAPDPSAVQQSGSGSASSSIDGGEVFVSTGCGSCHALEALGADAQGAIGPNLDTTLASKDAAYIEESIVDPSAEVAKGFPDGTMPQNYEADLSPEELQALVDFLVQATSDDGGAPQGGSSSGSSAG